MKPVFFSLFLLLRKVKMVSWWRYLLIIWMAVKFMDPIALYLIVIVVFSFLLLLVTVSSVAICNCGRVVCSEKKVNGYKMRFKTFQNVRVHNTLQ